MPPPNWISDFFSPPPRSSCLRELFTGGNHSGRVYLLQFSAARAWVSGLSRREPHKNWLPCCAFLHYLCTLPCCTSLFRFPTLPCCAFLHCAVLQCSTLLHCAVCRGQLSSVHTTYYFAPYHIALHHMAFHSMNCHCTFLW